MRERIEQKLFERNERKPEEKTEKQEPGLVSLKKEIEKVVQKYSSETFGEAKKKKTKEIDIGEKEGAMEEYPSKKYDFRENDWFKKLTPEKQEITEFEIISFIHETAKEELMRLDNKFFEKLLPPVKGYFEKNRKFASENKEPVLPSKELEGEVINAIEKYKNQFGFLPGDPYTLEPNCAGFINFVGNLFEHYGFKSGSVVIPEHVGLLAELKGNKRYVSDANFPEPLPFKKWIKEMEEWRKIKIRDITLGYSGGYESGVHYNLGKFFEELKRYDEAEKEYREAVGKDPNNASSYNDLGNLLVRLHRFPEAEKEYREALEVNPNKALTHFNLGLLFRGRREFDKSREELLKARELYEEQKEIGYVKKCDEILKVTSGTTG